MGAAAEDNAAQAGAGASALAEMVQARRLQRRAAQRNLARGTAAGASRELDPAPLMMPHKSTEEARRLLARQAEEARQHRDHQANQQQRKELKRRFAESSESVSRRATAKARLDAARLRLALASLLHPRLASHAAIRHEHAPALLDLLFDVATQPPLQFRPVSLSLLTVGHVALVGGVTWWLPARGRRGAASAGADAPRRAAAKFGRPHPRHTRVCLGWVQADHVANEYEVLE